MDLAQDIIVTIVAFSALGLVARRVIGAIRPAAGAQPHCASCASGAAACAKPVASAPVATPAGDVHPLTLVRPHVPSR